MVYAPHEWAYSSAGEHCIDIAGVTSSILVTPTIRYNCKSTARIARLLQQALVFGMMAYPYPVKTVI
jgi:hypothetical protein